MNYINDFNDIVKAFSQESSPSYLAGNMIHSFEFESQSFDILPGNAHHYCKEHDLHFEKHDSYYNEAGEVDEDLHQEDFCIEQNKKFKYYILMPEGVEKTDRVTFMFHGFNEKNWDKYLPWGQAICERTQSAIIFFPIAFHMHRAPSAWSEKRKMFALSEKRKKQFPNIINCTLSNVAISKRLHSMPQRFIWSGLQTYYDIIQFIESCKNGEHALIDKDFHFDIFAYSIGGFLAEILKLSNYKHYFDTSKVCLFCSGAVFNRLSPVSKFILDSEADVALYSYLVEHIDSFIKSDAHLCHYFGENHLEGKVFKAMLEYKKCRELREGLLKQSENDIMAISLKKDTVIPSFEIINTLQGAYRDINIEVTEYDFPYTYTHENPFPVNTTTPELINKSFDKIFDKVGTFLNK